MLVQRMVEYSDLAKQTDMFWWATNNMRCGHHSGAYSVLRELRKSGKTQLLRYRATKVLIDKGYGEHVRAADW